MSAPLSCPSLRRRLLVPALAALACAAAIVAACTTFDGLSAAPAVDAGGDAGDAGQPDTGPDVCVSGGNGYLTLAEAARACMRIAECDPDNEMEYDIESSLGVVTSHTDYTYCMNALAGATPPNRPGQFVVQQTFQCVAHASSCAEAKACLAIQTLSDQDPRCPDAGADASRYCDNGGKDIVDCANSFVEHCSAPLFASTSCIRNDVDGGLYFCGETVSTCTADAEATCDIATNVLMLCTPGATVSAFLDCRAFGLTCGASGVDGGQSDCLTDSVQTPCDPITFRNTCDGDSIATCNFYGRVSRTDCAALGRTCSMTTGTPLCVAPNDTCTPFSNGIGACQGDTLALCIDGTPTAFDCACAGLTCASDAGVGRAHCSTP